MGEALKKKKKMVQGSPAESYVNCGEDKNEGGPLVWPKGRVAVENAGMDSSLPSWGTSERGRASLTLPLLICEGLGPALRAQRPFTLWEQGDPLVDSESYFVTI